jgi:hypothetical protein
MAILTRKEMSEILETSADYVCAGAAEKKLMREFLKGDLSRATAAEAAEMLARARDQLKLES